MFLMKTLNLLTFTILNICLIFSLDIPIDVNLDTPAAVVDESFLSVAAAHIIKPGFIYSDLLSQKFITLANGLSGHSSTDAEIFLRVGGQAGDNLIFDLTNSTLDVTDKPTYILNATSLKYICKFLDKVGWKLVFGLNVLLRKDDGSWNPTNPMEFIDYMKRNNISVQYQLGNEPDLFPSHLGITITPKQLAKDYKSLYDILKEKAVAHSMLIGPGVATLTTFTNYIEYFSTNITEGVLKDVSFHHYYSSSINISAKNFTNATYLDNFLTKGLRALSIINESFSKFPHPPVWIGETGSTYGGGVPGLGESFAAGFLWLDKLGLAAQMNISVVIRQSLIGGYYALLKQNYDPNPDYWSSMVYKQLMGNIVLHVSGFLQYGREVRVYAHCINIYNRRGYQPSSIVLMALNLNPTEEANIRFVMDGWGELIADMYLFQPAYGKLSDEYVTLNGKLMKMVNDTTLPDITPVLVRQPYILPPLSYGFFVVLNNTVTACEI